MSHEDPGGQSHPQPTEEELRAQLEEELRRITVRDVLLQTVVSLVNLGGQRLGLGEEAQDMRDLDQVRLAIESVRALLPLLEEQDADQVKPIRDALAQLQLVYAREAGAGAPPPSGVGGGEGADQGERPPVEQPRRGGPGLWVPPGSGT